LLRRRIARAQTMLQNGNMSITEIASAVGFRDSTRFIKAFRKMVGVTPGRYRE
jgi:AraC-like DNA-binding protein